MPAYTHEITYTESKTKNKAKKSNESEGEWGLPTPQIQSFKNFYLVLQWTIAFYWSLHDCKTITFSSCSWGN